MSQVRHLIDESVRLSVVAALRRAEPAINVWRVGQSGMPPFGSPDPDILVFCEQQQRILVSLDRTSMPVHVAAYQEAGGHNFGVLLVTRQCSFRQLLDELLIIWAASDGGEWRNTIHYLPLIS